MNATTRDVVSPSTPPLTTQSAAGSGTQNLQFPAVDRVAIRIPPFWPEDPEMWFAQVETQFALSDIKQDRTKFNYVAGNLDAKFATEVRDILTLPENSTGRTYENLKTQLIGRLSASQDQKTRRLLEHEEIGDRTPSQFLRHLKGLAGTVFPDSVLRPLWLGRLPAAAQAILATQDQEQLDKLALLADAIVSTLNPKGHILEASTQLTQTAPNHLALEALFQQSSLVTNRVAEMTTTVAEIAASSKNRGRLRSRGRYQRNRSRSRSSNRDGVCWYHSRFGDDAKRCNPEIRPAFLHEVSLV